MQDRGCALLEDIIFNVIDFCASAARVCLQSSGAVAMVEKIDHICKRDTRPYIRDDGYSGVGVVMLSL